MAEGRTLNAARIEICRGAQRKRTEDSLRSFAVVVFQHATKLLATKGVTRAAGYDDTQAVGNAQESSSACHMNLILAAGRSLAQLLVSRHGGEFPSRLPYS